MYDDYDFSQKQLVFLDLFQLAAKYDCLALLDFYCMHLFDHDRISKLNEDQLAELADAARKDIFSEALAQGYHPGKNSFMEMNHDRFC